MNRAEELCHSSGPWKKHKYFKKIGEGANAVYRYTKSAAENPGSAVEDAVYNAKKFYNKSITGDEYKNAAESKKRNSEHDQELAKIAEGEGRENAKNRLLKEAEREGRQAAEQEYNYKTKSLKGIAENAPGNIKAHIENSKNKVKDTLTPKETVTITDTKTGKTRTPSKPKSQSDTVNIKKKKLKHDDLGVAYISHAETQSSVERGQEKINQLFGKWYN